MTSNVPDSSADSVTDAAAAPASSTPSPAGESTQQPSSRPGRNGPNGRGQRGAQGKGQRGGRNGQGNTERRGAAPARQHPVLDQLAELYPALFGEVLLPLKRGIFQDLLAAQPEALEKEGLKAALALHSRSSRYLTVVASGLPRHNLVGEAVENLAPEHVHHALIEVFRRRGARSREDLRPKMRQRIAVAFEDSGLSRDAYLELVSGKDEEVNQITKDGVDEAASRLARDVAMLRAFESSGKSLNEFADMYGIHVLEANRTLERAKTRRDKEAAAAEIAAAAAVVAAEEAAATQNTPDAASSAE